MAVRLLMEALCLLKGSKPYRINDPNGNIRMVWDYWGPSQKMLADVFFLRSLVNFDRNGLTDEVVAKVELLTTQEALQPESVLKVSKAAYSLCCWVTSIVRCHIANRVSSANIESKSNI